MSKFKLKWYHIGILALVIYIVSISPRTSTPIVPLGRPMSFISNLSNSLYNITVYTSNSYYIKDGCRTATLGSCNVHSEINGSEVGCPTYHYWSTGVWQNCDSTGYDSICAFGENCDSTDHTCDVHCSWGPRDYGIKGGVSYASRDGCAWYVTVANATSGEIIKRVSAIELNEAGWMESRPYVTQMLTLNDYHIIVGTESARDSAGDCDLVKFQASDDTWTYRGCVGSLCLFETIAGSFEKTCGLSCGSRGKNETTCFCCLAGEAATSCDGKIDGVEVNLAISRWVKNELQVSDILPTIGAYMSR